jgi:16S rRNA (guanine527-N7)-methyltransferase
MDFSVIQRYFGCELTEQTMSQLQALGDLYADWNSKINVISRRDIDNLYLHHVLHSLSIAKFLGELQKGTTFLDMGTGGGFPGVPLAIVYPDCKFHLIDRIAKKIRVASEISAAVGLKNVTFQHGDIGECHNKYDYVVSRAVMRLDALVPLIRKNVSTDCRNKYANGLVCLKGGDLEDESRTVSFPVAEYPLNEFFSEEFFETKKLIYVPMSNNKK